MCTPIRVASNSLPHRVAGAIAQSIREQKQVNVQAIGMNAVNQMLKSTIIARGYLEKDGLDMLCQPSFVEVEVDGATRTAMRLTVMAEDLLLKPEDKHSLVCYSSQSV